MFFHTPPIPIVYLLAVKSDRSSLQATEDVDSKVAAQEEDDNLLEEKPPIKTAKRHSARKAAVKEAKEAKEAAAAAKASSGWATTFTLDRVQYVLQDATGHPVSTFFYLILLFSHKFASDRRK